MRESFAPLAVVEGRGANEATAELLAASIANPSANSLWQLVLRARVYGLITIKSKLLLSQMTVRYE